MFYNIFRKIKEVRIKTKVAYLGKNPIVGNALSIIGGEYISIGDEFHAGRSVALQAWKDKKEKMKTTPQLLIGDNVSFMGNVMISCANKISIGNGDLLGDNVLISDNSHGKLGENVDIPPVDRKIYPKDQ